jgi:cysteinyl-tRNA synthetase
MSASQLYIYNSLTSKKEKFEPINPPFVGLYVCGPTVYNEAHLGNIRTFLTFDIVYRYLIYLGYKVRYVRNITDVGHLVDDVDFGEDKIEKRARFEKIEPMEIVQKYTNSFHQTTQLFNLKNPDIEPSATGHIIEQIEMIQKIISNGYGYEVNGSVYFDVKKYASTFNYGELSGRKLDELLEQTRENLEGGEEKQFFADFAIWKKASPETIMKWNSPWGIGVPGWHLECSAMSTKYLGQQFDIHGGGMDLKFPHHECEIAQSVGSGSVSPVKYWMHGNMLTVNGSKMSKSLGNSFLPMELITGNHPLLDKGYSPMTVRFFFLQAHYRSTVNFSNEALKASEKGFRKIINGLIAIKTLNYIEQKDLFDKQLNNDIERLCSICYAGMNDDFNSAIVIANLFNLLKYINSFHHKVLLVGSLKKETFAKMKETYIVFVEDILGLKEEKLNNPNIIDDLLEVILNMYSKAKLEKDYVTVDLIRAKAKKEGIQIKDTKDGAEWTYEE